MAAEDHNEAAQAARLARGRRRPPTIELTATEIRDPPAAADAADEKTGAAPPSDPGSGAAASSPSADTAAPAPAEAASPGAAAPDSGAASPAAQESEAAPVQPAAASVPEASAETAAASDAPASSAQAPASGPEVAARLWPFATGAAAGAAVLLLGVAIFAFAVGLPARQGTVQGLAERLTLLETRLATMAQREVPAAASPGDLAALAERLTQLEGRLSAPMGRMDTLAAAVARLESELAGLRQREEEIAAAAAAARRQADAAVTAARGNGLDDLAALRQRIVALERLVPALQAEQAKMQADLAARPAVLAQTRALRLAVIAEALQAAVQRGSPFRAELDAARAVVADSTLLAPLETFAATGLPSPAALAQELRPLLAAQRDRQAPPAEGAGFLARLQANAERLVRIRPVGEMPAGEDAQALLARADMHAARGELASARAAIEMLAPEPRAPFTTWLQRVAQRDAALEAARRFANSALAAAADGAR